jgi:hypothetical protein
MIHYYRQINKRVVTRTTITMLTNHKSISAKAQYLFHTITTKNHQKKPPEYHQRIQKTPKETRKSQVSSFPGPPLGGTAGGSQRAGSALWEYGLEPCFFLPGLQGFTIGKSSIRKLGT